MSRLLEVSLPDEVAARLGLSDATAVSYDDLRRRWAAEEAQRWLGKCQEAAQAEGLTPAIVEELQGKG